MNHMFNAIVFVVSLLTGAALAGTGHIKVELTAADLNSSTNSYVLLCVQTSTQNVSLPLQDRLHCVDDCNSPLAPYGKHALYDYDCPDIGNHIISDQSQIIYEIYADHDHGNYEFMCGNTITIKELLDRGLNERIFDLPLNGVKNFGVIWTTITWYPTSNGIN